MNLKFSTIYFLILAVSIVAAGALTTNAAVIFVAMLVAAPVAAIVKFRTLNVKTIAANLSK